MGTYDLWPMHVIKEDPKVEHHVVLASVHGRLGSYKTWTGFWTGMESGISSLMA